MEKPILYYYHDLRTVLDGEGYTYNIKEAVRMFNMRSAVAGNKSFKRLARNHGDMEAVEQEYIQEMKNIKLNRGGKKTYK